MIRKLIQSAGLSRTGPGCVRSHDLLNRRIYLYRKGQERIQFQHMIATPSYSMIEA